MVRVTTLLLFLGRRGGGNIGGQVCTTSYRGK